MYPIIALRARTMQRLESESDTYDTIDAAVGLFLYVLAFLCENKIIFMSARAERNIFERES